MLSMQTSFSAQIRSGAVPLSLGHSGPSLKVHWLISPLLSIFHLTIPPLTYSAHELCPTSMQTQSSKCMSGSSVCLRESENSQMSQRTVTYKSHHLNTVLQLLGLHHFVAILTLPLICFHQPLEFIILVPKIQPSLKPVTLLLSNTHPLP